MLEDTVLSDTSSSILEDVILSDTLSSMLEDTVLSDTSSSVLLFIKLSYIDLIVSAFIASSAESELTEFSSSIGSIPLTFSLSSKIIIE